MVFTQSFLKLDSILVILGNIPLGVYTNVLNCRIIQTELRNKPKKENKMDNQDILKSCYCRGGADAWYNRSCSPHYYTDTIDSRGADENKVERADMTDEQVSAYVSAYDEGMDSGDHKDWG